jgi:spermidine synthase
MEQRVRKNKSLRERGADENFHSKLGVPMSEIGEAPEPHAAGKYYPVLLCFFIGSGIAALIYEIVWFQLIEFVIGSTAASLAVLLGAFMGGMCIGSLAFARVVPATVHPLKAYAAMELSIGLIAVLILYLLPPAADLYSTIAGHGFSGVFSRAALCAAFLLAPTVLMGATLPCAARWLDTTPRGLSWLGVLYTGNLAGAVFGCLLAGFYLLRVHDMAAATFAAAAINAVCAALAFSLARIAPHRAPPAIAGPPRSPLEFGTAAVYVVIALSGLTSLGAQVVWTRLLSLLLGPSVYTFSIILAVFLLGLGLGSSAASMLVRGGRNPLAALGWCQVLLVPALGWAAFSIDGWLPYWPIDPKLSANLWVNYQLDLARCLWAVLPAAYLWGASFPLALAAAAPQHADSGRMVGAVYAANTVGAILGAVLFSIAVVPAVGTLGAQRILIAIAALSAIIALVARMRSGEEAAGASLTAPVALGGSMAVTLAAAALWQGAPPVPRELYAFGRTMMNPEFPAAILYAGEGVNASVAVSKAEDGTRSFHVSGKSEAGSHAVPMRLQRMLGHIPALANPAPRSVLVVGFGAGVTAGSFVTYPEIERIVICEIEPLIPAKIAGFFSQENYDVAKDPRVEIVYDDARRFVLTTQEKFDIITSDPIHPWVKGAAALYTREYFELVKRRLKPGGVVTQWVPLYESSFEVVKSEMATFFAVFPDGVAWFNDREGGGDLVLMGRADPAPIDVDHAAGRLSRPENGRVEKSLRDLGYTSAINLLSSYAGYAPDLAEWLKGAAINTDRDLRLQYLAGMGLNVNAQDQIHSELVAARRIPAGLFSGSAQTLANLKSAIESNESFRFFRGSASPNRGAADFWNPGRPGMGGRAEGN